MRQVKVLNVSINNITMTELLENLQYGGVVFTPNVNHVMQLQKNPDFYYVYKEADYIVCDSKILMYAASFLNIRIKEKISGSDLFPAFYNHYKHDENVKIFLLGGEAELVKTAQRKINAKAGRNIVVAAHSPSFGFEKNEEECQNIVNMINSSGATVLAIGVGAPKQEMWISKYKGQLKKIKTFLAIGATINFEAGNFQRSPKWMSEVGIEWLHRLLSEPQRLWKRYLFDAIPFLFLILQQKFQLYENPWSVVKQHQLNKRDYGTFSKAGHKKENMIAINTSLSMNPEKEEALQEHIQAITKILYEDSPTK
ncbi:WecB/TagA/CpsF family glycosyltransferase [Nostocaceae cyanobacterium CENA357]|uniref:WecB/TagA/CpsF family glycosyltransferase n=1 Tax=Atlanticothrix silvestris CENA357 TaxID=1725252 RepID=A0A8J7HF89_9CYAN|nr:WecB/TagA/CpsF family glycosyltransferase [Atlanticothrix silvestris]MBH8553906.1 WecB/TagA/CpsF family glycosyltransferase [Atlanticothrix silvestris CENA357]